MSRVTISMKAARALMMQVHPASVDHWSVSELRCAMEPKRKPRKPSKSERRDETGVIRAACWIRCAGVCECGCGQPVHYDAAALQIDWNAQAELDHVFSKGKGARLPQSVETCWILRADCHRERTLNRPDAATWWRKFADHAFRHDYHRAYHAARDRAAFVEARSTLGAELKERAGR